MPLHKSGGECAPPTASVLVLFTFCIASRRGSVEKLDFTSMVAKSDAGSIMDTPPSEKYGTCIRRLKSMISTSGEHLLSAPALRTKPVEHSHSRGKYRVRKSRRIASLWCPSVSQWASPISCLTRSCRADNSIPHDSRYAATFGPKLFSLFSRKSSEDTIFFESQPFANCLPCLRYSRFSIAVRRARQDKSFAHRCC